MLLFRLVDLPRRVRRLTVPVPLDPASTGTDAESGSRVVDWMLAPAMLDRDNRRLRARVAAVLALYAGAEGRPRTDVEALSARIEEALGDYRLARCLARTIEYCGYQFVPPPIALTAEPAALRALCYRRAQEQYSGFVPRERRSAFLDAVAGELDTTAERLEAALWADRAGAALLRRRSEPGGAVASIEMLQPARIIALYNTAAVATLVAASSWVTVCLAASETAALKDLYRRAKALHVGVEISQGATPDMLDLTLYGPGSRALVRSRAVMADGTEVGARSGRAGDTVTNGEPAARATGPATGSMENGGDDAGVMGSDETDERRDGDSAETHDGGGAGVGDLRVPAAGGGAVAMVVTRLVQSFPAAVRGGWLRLLGADHRLYHVPLDEQALAALGAERDEGEGAVGETDLYDSAVEEDFARAFHAHESAGRSGLVHGWAMQREPRAVVVEGTVFLPDFIFRRGEVEVYSEVIGYYTDEYLTRKRRKLATFRGQIPLLLIVDQDLASVFSEGGFPIVTYRSGRQIAVADVVRTLDHVFDPFARRRDRARAIFARLCATAGPDMSEEDLSVALGCAGRSELLSLWTDLHGGAQARGDTSRGNTTLTERFRSVAEARERYATDDGADRFTRRYVPGYGLVQGGVLVAARAALTDLLHQTAGPIALGLALECVGQAGVSDPDESLLERLGAVVARPDLFGEAQVYLPGMVVADPGATVSCPETASSRGRRRPKRGE